MDTFANFAAYNVSTGYNAAAVSIDLAAGGGARMPATPFNATWWNITDYPDPSDDPNREIVRVTNIAADTLTITRAQEGTAATTKNTALKTYRFVAGWTALTANTDVRNAASLNSGTLAAARMPALTNDVTTVAGTVATTIANNAVTLAKMNDMATDAIIGRATGGVGDPEILTALPFAFTGDVTRAADSNAQTIANDAVTTAKILDANVTLAKMANMATDSIIGRATAGAGVPEILAALPFAFTGDVTRPVDSNAQTIANDAVSYAKMQNVSATSRIIGRKTAGAGDPEECTLSEILDFISSAAQGDILYRGAATWARLAAGTSGWFLKTNGAGADPAWAAAAGGGGTAPTDPTQVFYKDEWGIVVGKRGELGWESSAMGGGATSTAGTPTWPHLGVNTLTTAGAAAGDGGYYTLTDSTVIAKVPFSGLATNANWTLYWIFKLSSTANIRFRAGVVKNGHGTAVDPTDWMGCRYDTNAGIADAQFKFVTRSASTESTQNLGAVDTNWHTFRMRSTSAGTILGSLDGAADVSLATNVPTNDMTPYIAIATDTNAAKAIDIDYFSFMATGVSR
jgi:hypothetical protein